MSEKIIEIRKPTQKQTVKTNRCRYKKRRFFRSRKNKGYRTPGSGERFSCGRFRFCAADLVRPSAGAVSVWGGVRHAVRPAPITETNRFFAAVLHGAEGRADHPDF
jgi:hypothetical protein